MSEYTLICVGKRRELNNGKSPWQVEFRTHTRPGSPEYIVTMGDLSEVQADRYVIGKSYVMMLGISQAPTPT